MNANQWQEYMDLHKVLGRAINERILASAELANASDLPATDRFADSDPTPIELWLSTVIFEQGRLLVKENSPMFKGETLYLPTDEELKTILQIQGYELTRANEFRMLQHARTAVAKAAMRNAPRSTLTLLFAHGLDELADLTGDASTRKRSKR